MTRQAKLYPYDVKLPGWADTLRIRGTSEADAIGFARLQFKCASDGEITATLAAEEVEELRARIAANPAPRKADQFMTHSTIAETRARLRAAGGKRGRPALSIAPDLICDTLKKQKSIKGAARELGCSRAYIYAALGAEKVKELAKV